MARLDYDMDNFSGRWSRGKRYDIELNGNPYYTDIPEDVVDRLARELREKWECIYGEDCVRVIEL